MSKNIKQEEYCNDLALSFTLFTSMISFFTEKIQEHDKNFPSDKKHRMLAEVIGNMHYMWSQKSVMGKDASKGSFVAQKTIDAMFQTIAIDCELITENQVITFEHKEYENGHQTAVFIGTPKDKNDNIPTHINNDLGATA